VTIVNLDFDQGVWVRSRLMSVRRIRSGICRVEAGPASSQVVITTFPPGRNRRAPPCAAAAIELAKWNASTPKIGSALPPGRPVSVRSTCWKLARPVHKDRVHALGLGRRHLHCRDRESAPGTPSRRVVAEGTLIGK
jgi:hypothetical protein